MQAQCRRCRHVLEYDAEQPAFCSRCGFALADTQPDTLAPLPTISSAAPPQTIGPYRLLRELGQGGMGTVFEAEDTVAGRRVALKLMAPEYAEDLEAVERFRREGRLASMISHPRCVFVHAADEEQGRPYIVMELMPGQTLEDVVGKQGPLSPGDAVKLILDVLEALREVHRLGFVHRDVKPSNCFLDAEGHVKLGDFGLARSLLGEGRLTRTGSFVGTPLFASPEQVKGEAVDPRSDVYSAAATLFFLLTGRAPFQGTDTAAAVARIASEEAPLLRSLRPDLSAGLEHVVQRGLARDRQQRWASVDEFRAALAPFGPPVGETFMLRMAAVLLDTLLLLPLQLVMLFFLVLSVLGEPGTFPWPAVFLDTALWLIYFALLEGVWGWSLGKRLVGLRVGDEAGRPPGVRRAGLRAGLFLAYWMACEACLVILLERAAQLGMPERLGWLSVWSVGLNLVWLAWMAVLACTMRPRNGYRGLHEFLSGTRVLRLPEEDSMPAVPARDCGPTLSEPDGLPESLGPFRIRGRLAGGVAALLLAEDGALSREVLLWLRRAEEPPPSEGRRQVSRASRLRWLTAGQAEVGPWDAFLAPAGRPLPEVLASGPLAWKEARPILSQLANELTAACADDTLPEVLTVGQVWVAASGRVQLLDWPQTQGPPGAAPPERAVALLRQVAALLLAPTVGASLPEHAARMRDRLLGLAAPYCHPREFQADLAASRQRPTEVTRARRAAHLTLLAFCLIGGVEFMLLGSLMVAVFGLLALSEEIQVNSTALESLQVLDAKRAIRVRDIWVTADGQPLAETYRVTPDGRAVLTTRTPVTATVLTTDKMQTFPSTSTYHFEDPAQFVRVAALIHQSQQQRREDLQRARQQYQAQLNAGWVMRPIAPLIGLGNPQVHFSRLTGITEARKDLNEALVGRVHGRRPGPWRDVLIAVLIAFACWLSAWPLLWVAWAFLFRGGLTYHLMGLSLVRRDGRRAGRFRCAWRTLLAWLPVVALLFASIWLETWYWANWDIGEPYRWVFWLAQAAWWGAIGYLGLAIVLAMRSPQRTLLDRLAGTWLVPR
jgi:hypothetical protein